MVQSFPVTWFQDTITWITLIFETFSPSILFSSLCFYLFYWQQIYQNLFTMSIGNRQSQRSESFGNEPSYQINTGKVVKGHKLTMKNLLQKQKIKSKNSSPTNKNKQFNQACNFTPKMTDFSEKYKGLQTLDDEQSLYRFIIYQREKQSRQSARGIKLFNCQRKSNTLEEESFLNNHISFSARTTRNAKTSQSNRKNRTSLDKSQNNTISYEPPISDQGIETKITYLSDNLGRRMNEYLNIILQKKQKAELTIKQDEIKEEAELYKLKNELVNQMRVMNKNIKIKSNNFYRQMKKNKKNRILSAQNITETVKENELVKSLMKRTSTIAPEKSSLNTQRNFMKSFSTKVRADEQSNKTMTRSFYSKRQKIQQQSSKLQIDNLLSIIYKK